MTQLLAMKTCLQKLTQIVDGKLFVLLQRRTFADPVLNSYVAVIDVATDEEIDTGKGEADSLAGIPLDTTNATNIRFNAVTEEIYVTGRGNLYRDFNQVPGDPFLGGLFSIDQTTYDTAQLLDDGDEATNNGIGFIEHSLVVSDTKGYVTMYTGSDENTFAFLNTVYTFNPSTGELGDPVAAVADREIGPMATDLDGNVWIGIRGATPGFSVIDPVDDTTEKAFVSTEFTPTNVVFMAAP